MARTWSVGLALWLGANVWLLMHQGAERVREDRAIAAAESLAGRYAVLYGNAALTPQFEQLFALRERMLAGSVERAVLVVPLPFTFWVPLARHALFPIQILEELPGGRSEAQLQAEVVRLDVGALLRFEPAAGWTLWRPAGASQ